MTAREVPEAHPQLGGSPPFVGRENELGWLEDCLLDAQRGHPHLALVAGEAGIGKSRLAREFGALARRSGVRVCVGRSHESLRLPYLPFVEALRLPLEPRPGAQGTSASLQSARVPWPESGERERLRFFLATSQLLVGHAREEPTLLVVEDLQWADPSSLDLLSYLVGSIGDAALQGAVPILIVGTYRPLEASPRLHRTLARLERESLSQRIELHGLEESETRRLVERMGVGRASHQLLETLLAATCGNPLFLQEALRHLVEHGQLEHRAEYAFVKVPEVELLLPSDVTAAVAGRVRHVGSACRRVLTFAAFLGDPIDLSVLAVVSGTDGERLTELLEEAARQRLLIAEGLSYRFRHPTVRHVLLQEPGVARRRRIHLRIAEVLERKHADALDEHAPEIAQHLLAAGPDADEAEVIAWARRASERARALFAWGEAARYLAAAVQRAQSGGRFSARELGELHFRAGNLYHFDWDPGPCREHYERALDAYRAAGDVRGLVTVLDHEARAVLALGATSYGKSPPLRALEEAVAQLGDEEPRLRALVAYTMSEACWAGRQPEKAEELARRALDLGQQLDDAHVQRSAHLALGLAQHQGLRVPEALESWQRCLAQARRGQDPWWENAPRQRIGMALAQLGRLDEAEAVAREGLALARRTQDAGETSLALANAAILAVARGRFEAAETHARETMTLVYRSRYPWGGALALWAVACARAQRGESAESVDAIELLGQRGRVFEDPGPVNQLLTPAQRALLEPLEPGAPRCADAQLDDLARASRLLGVDAWLLWVFCALVEIAERRARPELASHAASILSLAEERGVLLTSGWVFLIPRVLGVAAACDGRWDEAELRFEAALRVAARIGASPELARTRLDYARMLLRRGGDGSARARELLQQACQLFATLGMHPFLRQAQALGEPLGLDPRETSPQHQVTPDRLSRREVDVLRRLAGGEHEQEIGEELLLRAETVGRYVGRIFEKIEVESRVEAAGYAFQEGLLTSPEPEARGPIVILVTDIEGFTPLVERLGDARARKVIHHHNHLLRRCLRAHAGAEITHTGDGIMASFRSAPDAIHAALDMQAAFQRFNLEHRDTPLGIRIGLSAGRPLITEDRLFGSAINAAARICGQAQAGSILLSETVRGLLGERGFQLAGRGPVALKGFSDPVQLYELRGAVSEA